MQLTYILQFSGVSSGNGFFGDVALSTSIGHGFSGLADASLSTGTGFSGPAGAAAILLVKEHGKSDKDATVVSNSIECFIMFYIIYLQDQ